MIRTNRIKQIYIYMLDYMVFPAERPANLTLNKFKITRVIAPETSF